MIKSIKQSMKKIATNLLKSETFGTVAVILFWAISFFILVTCVTFGVIFLLEVWRSFQ